MLNRYDFRCVLNVANVRDRRRSSGRLFQARGPATARARSPMVESGAWTGTRTSAVDAERSRRRESSTDICQFATGSNQLRCDKFLNEVERVLKDRQRTLSTLL